MDDVEYIAANALPCRWCGEQPTWGDLVITVLGCKCDVIFGIDRNWPEVTIAELVSEWNKRLGQPTAMSNTSLTPKEVVDGRKSHD